MWNNYKFSKSDKKIEINFNKLSKQMAKVCGNEINKCKKKLFELLNNDCYYWNGFIGGNK
jgi:hypothetical protein